MYFNLSINHLFFNKQRSISFNFKNKMTFKFQLIEEIYKAWRYHRFQQYLHFQYLSQSAIKIQMKKMINILFFLNILAHFAIAQSNSSALICPIGFFSTSKRCVQCHIGCFTCEGFDKVCKACPKGQKLNENKGVCQNCQKGYLICSQTLIQCQQNYQLIQRKCRPKCAVKNCNQCVQNDFQTCHTCKTGYKITVDKKLCAKQQNSINTQSQSKQCAKGEYQFNKTCLKCHSHCERCIDNQNHCLQCNGGRIKLGWKCVNKIYVEFNITLSLQEEDLNIILLDGIDQFKLSLVRYFLPYSYQNQNISVVLLKHASLNKDKKTVNFSGIIDTIQKSDPFQTNKYLFTKLRSRNNLGIYTLVSSNTRVIGSTLRSQEGFSDKNSSVGQVDNEQNQKKKQQQQENEKRVTSIILGATIGATTLIIVFSLIISYLCRCCIFQSRTSGQRFEVKGQKKAETERKLGK